MTIIKCLMERTSPYPATLTTDVIDILFLFLMFTHEHARVLQGRDRFQAAPSDNKSMAPGQAREVPLMVRILRTKASQEAV